jgi:hypothetical protein
MRSRRPPRLLSGLPSRPFPTCGEMVGFHEGFAGFAAGRSTIQSW